MHDGCNVGLNCQVSVVTESEIKIMRHATRLNSVNGFRLASLVNQKKYVKNYFCGES